VAYEGRDRDGKEAPGVLLARLLRQWWEDSGNSLDGSRPTQQALASRMGIDQTTLSRYLNHRHPSTAPPRVVEALHAHLHAPATDLTRAQELCRAALGEQSRQREADNEPASIGGGESSTATTGNRDAQVSHRAWWTLPALVAAVVAAFFAGVIVRGQFPLDQVAEAGKNTSDAGVRSDDGHRWPLIRMRSHEDQFVQGRTVQNLLKYHGYEVKMDGIIGRISRDAVMRFQRKHQLTVDGKVGDDTWPWLVVEEIGLGDQNDAVRALQDLLNRTDDDHGGTEVSGLFTTATEADLKFFQRRHGLPATGQPDKETWRLLLRHQRPPTDTPSFQKTSSPPSPGPA
jgi:transcriptional regulator with XRE-family HTH domain